MIVSRIDNTFIKGSAQKEYDRIVNSDLSDDDVNEICAVLCGLKKPYLSDLKEMNHTLALMMDKVIDEINNFERITNHSMSSLSQCLSSWSIFESNFIAEVEHEEGENEKQEIKSQQLRRNSKAFSETKKSGEEQLIQQAVDNNWKPILLIHEQSEKISNIEYLNFDSESKN